MRHTELPLRQQDLPRLHRPLCSIGSQGQPRKSKGEGSQGEHWEGEIHFLEALPAEKQHLIELRSQLLNVLLAGRDTTASLLGWVFYLLVLHPAVWHKLRAFVIEDFGTYANPSEISFAKMEN